MSTPHSKYYLSDHKTVYDVWCSIYPKPTTENQPYWNAMCCAVEAKYKLISSEPLKKDRQKRIFGKCKSKKMVSQYPDSFIPTMIKIIQQHVWLAKRKAKNAI